MIKIILIIVTQLILIHVLTSSRKGASTSAGSPGVPVLRARGSIYIYIYIYTCRCVCVYIYIYVCITHIYIYIYICM